MMREIFCNEILKLMKKIYLYNMNIFLIIKIFFRIWRIFLKYLVFGFLVVLGYIRGLIILNVFDYLLLYSLL